MKEYICTVCGYIHKGELPEDFVCPVCGAGREAFREVGGAASVSKAPARHVESELSAMEMSIICSNLARGCEKKYLVEQSEQFAALANFFRSEAEEKNASFGELLKLIEDDLNGGYPYAREVAQSCRDRGAMRSLVWGEKVTNMLNSLLARYLKEGEKMLKNTGVYLCTVCGFIYIGDAPPEICPVCKVPSWKFERQQGRTE